MMQVKVKNILNIISLYLFFRELQGAKGPLVNIIPSTRLFYDVHFLKQSNMGNMKKGSPLLSHF
jgi:hypothetical protein